VKSKTVFFAKVPKEKPPVTTEEEAWSAFQHEHEESLPQHKDSLPIKKRPMSPQGEGRKGSERKVA